jgi:hypothetical protein
LIIDGDALFVPPFQVLQIDAETDSHQKIERRAKQSPTIITLGVISQLPKREEDKENDSARNQYSVSDQQQFHGERVPIKHSQAV